MRVMERRQRLLGLLLATATLIGGGCVRVLAGGASGASPGADAATDGLTRHDGAITQDATTVAPTVAWARRFGDTGDDVVNAITADGKGNVFVTGSFQGGVDFGGTQYTSVGAFDSFVASYDSAGKLRWSRRLGGVGGVHAEAIAVDPQGDVTVAGRFRGAALIGGEALISEGGDDVFVIRFDGQGTPLWTRHLGGPGDDAALDLVRGPSGKICAAGTFEQDLSWAATALVSAGASDGFVVCIDAKGNEVWSTSLGGAGTDEVKGVTVASSGDVVVLGTFAGTIDLGDGPRVSAGLGDVFVASYRASGALRWSRRFGTSLADLGCRVVSDGQGNVYVTGLVRGAVDFGGGQLPNVGGADIFLASYAADGSYRWAKILGDSLLNTGLDIASDGADNVYLSARFTDGADLGGGRLDGAGGFDIALASYDPAGAHRWSMAFGSDGNDTATTLTVDGAGVLTFAGGSTSGTLEIGGEQLVGKGQQDIVIVQLKP